MPKLVKSIALFKEDYLVTDLNSDDLRVNRFLFHLTHYDENGNTTEELKFTPDGYLEEKVVKKYNTEGYMTGEMYYTAEDELAEHRTFEQDLQGRINGEFIHYQDGTVDAIRYFYNSDGHLVKKLQVDDTGVVESAIVFTYENGRLVSEKEMDADDETVMEQTWSFNDDGHLIEHTQWDAQDERMVRTRQETDDQGRAKKMMRFVNDRLVDRQTFEADDLGRIIQIMEENQSGKSTTILTYDGHGNVILQEETDADGNLITRVERLFDEENRILESHVFIHGMGRRMNQKYLLRYEYTFFE